jgi:hypothetical protein
MNLVIDLVISLVLALAPGRFRPLAAAAWVIFLMALGAIFVLRS